MADFHARESSAREPVLSDVIATALSRRQFLLRSGTASAAAFITLNSTPGRAESGRQLLGFEPISASKADRVTVPDGYETEVLISWGDPLFPNAAEFHQDADVADQERQFGDNNDGMTFFRISEDRALLAVNNEYTNYEYLFAHQGRALTAADVQKAQAAHGVSIVELRQTDGAWRVSVDGEFNRRITANTPMAITGPAAGDALLKTESDPTGRHVLGTFNNCANGETPWGTFLTCEENFSHYFRGSNQRQLDETYQLYGIPSSEADYHWYEHDARFDVSANPNEPHRFGWVVEVDPRDPNSTPKKRTALGRFKHENAALVVNGDGRVVVYLGDDERGEFLYKFVSKDKYDPRNSESNLDLLDRGTLYVARLRGEEGELKGTGQWIELTCNRNGLTVHNGFESHAEVLIFARRAARVVGATSMDRPEWVAVHPDNAHVFCTLTNNKERGVNSDQPVNAANPRTNNIYGHILRWLPEDGDHTSDRFRWDLFLLAGNPHAYPHTSRTGSDSITTQNMFNSPDGLGFDKDGRLWIQTDGDYTDEGDFVGMGNNQMLCADPLSGEVRRFLTGPVACEVTGLTFSDDYRTMFVGIQHPGEKGADSHFPGGGDSIPRSSVVMIRRKDGGVIGT